MRKTISLPLWWKVRSATYAISVFFLFWVSIHWFNKVWKDIQEKDVACLIPKWSMWFIHHNAEKQIDPQKKSTFWEYVCYRWKETQCFLYYCYTVNFIFYTIGPRKTPLNGLDNEKCLPFFHAVLGFMLHQLLLITFNSTNNSISAIYWGLFAFIQCFFLHLLTENKRSLFCSAVYHFSNHL